MGNENGVVSFTHTNWKGEEKDRRVIPHRVWESDSYMDVAEYVWVLEGFCLDKKESRSFLLDKVEDVKGLLDQLEGKVSQVSLNVYMKELEGKK